VKNYITLHVHIFFSRERFLEHIHISVQQLLYIVKQHDLIYTKSGRFG